MMTPREQKIFQIRILRERSRRECEHSLAEFGRQAWHIIEPGRPFEDGWHIETIGEHLKAMANLEIRNLIINIPPRHMKSILGCVLFPSWVWGPFNHPHKDWLFSSYSPKLTSRDSQKCRKIIESQWYRERWADRFTVDDARRAKYQRTGSLLMEDQNEKMNYRNIHSGSRIATSQGGTGTGEGGDIIVFDDPHKVGAAESDTRRESTISYWEDEMSTRGNDPKTVCRLIIMQRVHERDLSAEMLEKYGDMYEHLVLPFEREKRLMVDMKPRTSLGFKDPRTREGERLWKRFEGKPGDDLVRLIKPYQRSGQLQQRPSPKEGVIFKRDWFRNRWSRLPGRFEYMVTTWDLTFGTGETKEDGKKNRGAYDVGYALGWFRGKYYVVDEIRERLEPWQQESEVGKLKEKWVGMGCRAVLIEDAANGRATGKKLKMNVSGVILVRPDGSKEERAEAQTDVFRAGDVLFPEDGATPWAADAVEEFVSFGSRAKFKDRVDALCQGIDHLEVKVSRRKKLLGADVASIEKESIWDNVGA